MTRQAKNTNTPLILSSFGGAITASNDLHVVGGKSNYHQLVHIALAQRLSSKRVDLFGTRLISELRSEYIARNFENVEGICHLILALPLPKQIKAVAHWYQAYCLRRQGDIDAALPLLYRAANEASPEYKARTFQSIGCAYYHQGDTQQAIPLFVEAGRLGQKHDPITFIQSQQLLCEILSTNGDSRWAIKGLEAIFPAVITAARTSPVLYYEFLNNWAVDLAEVGRVDEAQSALNVALNSPYASAFPEWAQTRDELETKRRHPRPSFVSLSSAKSFEPTPKRKKRRRLKPERRSLARIVRALAMAFIAGLPFKNRDVLYWLAGLSIFRSDSFALVLTKPVSVDLEALLTKTSDWPTSGPGPRAPPVFNRFLSLHSASHAPGFLA